MSDSLKYHCVCSLLWLVVFAITFFPLFFTRVYPYMRAQSWPVTVCTVHSARVSTDCDFFSAGAKCGVACDPFAFTSLAYGSRPVFNVTYAPINAAANITATAYSNLYGAVGAGGYMPLHDATALLGLLPNGSRVACWYNPADPGTVSLANGYDTCMILTLAAAGLSNGISAVIALLCVCMLLYNVVRRWHEPTGGSFKRLKPSI